jgi:hypothetical protein
LNIFIFAIEQELWACEIMDRIMGYNHFLDWKDIIKFIYCFMILFLTVYIFKYFLLLVPFSNHGSAIMFSFNFDYLFAWIRINMWIYIYIYIYIKDILKSHSIERGYQWVYLYFYDPLQVINFNSLNIQVYNIILCHVIFLHWKIFLKIQVACHITLCHIIFLNWKTILKIQ